MQDDIDIVWLASYPKTGSTWLKEIINQIISPEEKAADSIPSFQKKFPSDAPVHEVLDGRARIVKTHFYPGNKRMTGFQGECVGAITIFRHPLDVLLSAINYAKLKGKSDYFLNGKIKSVEQIIDDGEFSYYSDSFVNDDGVSIYTGTSGKWSEYQKRWDEFGKDVKYLSLRYEDMVADPGSAIHEIQNFLGEKYAIRPEESIMAESENRTALNGKFFWKKKAYNFKEMLTEPLIEEFYEKMSESLKEQGY